MCHCFCVCVPLSSLFYFLLPLLFSFPSRFISLYLPLPSFLPPSFFPITAFAFLLFFIIYFILFLFLGDLPIWPPRSIGLCGGQKEKLLLLNLELLIIWIGIVVINSHMPLLASSVLVYIYSFFSLMFIIILILKKDLISILWETQDLEETLNFLLKIHSLLVHILFYLIFLVYKLWLSF